MSSLSVVDLFCGCGGLSLGAARAGFTVVAGVDKDLRALKAHELNFPETRHSSCDLSAMSGSELLAELRLKRSEIDVITGGPPCQGFSVMGKRDLQDTRNLLLVKFLRLIDEIKPKAFVLENVPGLLNDHYKQILATALESVKGSYTVFSPKIVTAFEVGAPTLRKRVFIVGFRKNLKVEEKTFWKKPPIEHRAPVVSLALEGLPLEIDPDWKNSKTAHVVAKSSAGYFFESASARIPKGIGNLEHLSRFESQRLVTGCVGTKHSADLRMRYSALRPGQSDRRSKSIRLDADGYCPTLRAGTGPDKGSFQAVRPIHHIEARVITPREAARLQGFPDWFLFDSTKWHSFRQIGNSVSPLVAEYVMKSVRSVLDYAGSTF